MQNLEARGLVLGLAANRSALGTASHHICMSKRLAVPRNQIDDSRSMQNWKLRNRPVPRPLRVGRPRNPRPSLQWRRWCARRGAALVRTVAMPGLVAVLAVAVAFLAVAVVRSLADIVGLAASRIAGGGGGPRTVGFHNFNLRIFNLRISNPNKLIVYVCLTRCRISMCQGLGPKNTMKFRKLTVTQKFAKAWPPLKQFPLLVATKPSPRKTRRGSNTEDSKGRTAAGALLGASLIFTFTFSLNLPLSFKGL